MTSSGLTLTSRNSRSVLSRSTSLIVRVTSTVMNSVTCGAVNAEPTMACAVILRTPLIGVRTSRSPIVAKTGAMYAVEPTPPSPAPAAALAAVPAACPDERCKGLGTWRLVRYADDFVVLVNGTRGNVEQVREQAIAVLEPMGLHLSEAKTQIVHMRGWANYFKHAVAKHTFDRLQDFIWWRVVNWVMQRHHLTWKALSRRLHGPKGWRPIVLEGIELFNLGSVSVTRYRVRGNHIPSPWTAEVVTPTA